MIKKLFAKMSGRTTAFCAAFFASGTILEWFHKLDMTYVAFTTAVLGAVVGHSIKEDYFNKPDPVPDPAKEKDDSHA